MNEIMHPGQLDTSPNGDGSSSDVIPPWEASTANHPLIKERVKSVAAALFRQIDKGRYSYGTRLPSERDLAEEFHLSRAVIRQAIEFLETYGIVTRRANSGAFVAYSAKKDGQIATSDQVGAQMLNISAIAETASPFEMNVLCSIIEPDMVRLAALYMSVRDLANLKNILEEIERIITNAELFAHLEKKFLLAIAEGTHNRLLLTIYTIIHEVRRQPRWCATRVKSLSPERIVENQARLRSLYNALENRDTESAVEFMKLLIAGHQDDLLNSR